MGFKRLHQRVHCAASISTQAACRRALCPILIAHEFVQHVALHDAKTPFSLGHGVALLRKVIGYVSRSDALGLDACPVHCVLVQNANEP